MLKRIRKEAGEDGIEIRPDDRARTFCFTAVRVRERARPQWDVPRVIVYDGRLNKPARKGSRPTTAERKSSPNELDPRITVGSQWVSRKGSPVVGQIIDLEARHVVFRNQFQITRRWAISEFLLSKELLP